MKNKVLLLVSVLGLGLSLGGCGGNKKKRPFAATASGVTTNTGSVNTSTNTNTSPADAPQLTTIAPQSGPLDGGTLVTLTGSKFTAQGAGETLVLFGTRAVRATPTSDTEIRVVAPPSTTPGQTDLRVVNELGAALVRGAFTFDPRAASLSFDPPVGHEELGMGGTKITLSVRSFAPLTANTTVEFDQTAAASVALIDTGTIVAEVPGGLTPGSVSITVSEAGQQVTLAGFRIQGPLAYGELTVNELFGNPGGIDANNDGTSTSSGDEFIELVNTTTEWVDLSYLTIWDGANQERHRFPNPTALPPGGAIVVFGSGTPRGFGEMHATRSAQQATSGLLGLNNGGDTIELRTQPGLNPTGTILFKVTYTTAPVAASLVNVNDGQRITQNPAPAAAYVDHSTLPNANGAGSSPGRKVDGSLFR